MRLIINDHKRLAKDVKYCDSLLTLSKFKVESLLMVEQKSEQVILLGQDLERLKSENKKLIRKVFIYKVLVGVGIIGTAFVLR